MYIYVYIHIYLEIWKKSLLKVSVSFVLPTLDPFFAVIKTKADADVPLSRTNFCLSLQNPQN